MSREELEKAKQALDAAKEARDAEVASSQAMILSLREELEKHWIQKLLPVRPRRKIGMIHNIYKGGLEPAS